MIKLSCLLIFLASFCANDAWANDTTKENSVDTLALQLFELFKKQKADVIIDRDFLNEVECERFDALILPNRRNATINYTRDSIIVVFANEFRNSIDNAIHHDVNLDHLNFIHVKTHYFDNKIFKEDYNEKLLGFEIYFTDQKMNYFLTIAPLVKSGGQWKVYLTEFNWRQDLKEE
jgi:hypothetical protein